MRTIEGRAHTVEGATVAVRLAVCECGGQAWLAYQVEGQTHYHLECVACKASYCPTPEGCALPTVPVEQEAPANADRAETD